MDDPRELVSFRCSPCKLNFKAKPTRIVDAPEQDWHPWQYFAQCPKCNQEGEQAPWERSFFKGWSRATGPRTEEGKAKVARNLLDNPNPEARQRTRFNAMKHGLTARVATFYPAKPGRYPHCASCRWLNNGCGEWDHGACQTRMELFLLHQIAFQTRDPGLLNDLLAEQQANTMALIGDMFRAIIQTGAEVRSPKGHHNQDGEFYLSEYVDQDGNVRTIEDISAHPLIKPLIEVMSRNSEILSRQGMTQKAQEEDAALTGFIDKKSHQEEQLTDFAERQTQALEKLTELIERGKAKKKLEPVLIEHQKGEGA